MKEKRLDPEQIINDLSPRQKDRLLALIAAGNSLPWSDADNDLHPLALVEANDGRSGTTVLNNRGWSAALLLLAENPSVVH